MPWPVIESEAFYTLFDQLKDTLEKQPITYPSAGIFIQILHLCLWCNSFANTNYLQTMKTLMAKLKVNELVRLKPFVRLMWRLRQTIWDHYLVRFFIYYEASNHVHPRELSLTQSMRSTRLFALCADLWLRRSWTRETDPNGERLQTYSKFIFWPT